MARARTGRDALPHASLAAFPIVIRGGSIVENRLVRMYRVINDGK